VIGDPCFVKKAFASDKVARAKIARYMLEGVTIEEAAERVAGAAKLTVKELVRRRRGNWRSDIRRIFAYVCYGEYGISIDDRVPDLIFNKKEVAHSRSINKYLLPFLETAAFIDQANDITAVLYGTDVE
jgi:hypothetical protein